MQPTLKTPRVYHNRKPKTNHRRTTKDAFPSSAAFDAIASALSSDAERKDAIKKGGAIFAFTLKNEAGEQQTWHIDLKETGTVGKGLAPEGKKPGGEFMLPCFCDLWHDLPG